MKLHLTFLTVCAAVALALGTPAADKPNLRAKAVTPNTTATTTNQIVKADARDAAVLKAVLQNLLTNPDFAIFAGRNKDQKTNVVIIALTPDVIGFSIHQMEADAGRKISYEEFQDLRNRNSMPETNTARRATFEGIDFGPNIMVAKREAPSILDYTAFPSAIGWIEAWLPGYSSDGNHALVRAWKGPSAHGANVTAYLEKSRNNTWKIVWLEVAYWA